MSHFFTEGTLPRIKDSRLRTLKKILGAGRNAELGDGAIPISLPLVDLASGTIYNSVTHPDVLYIPTGFGGYRYWMSVTPYPDINREQPNIFASNDGVNWVQPSGGSNPIALRQEAIDALGAGSFIADGDLLYINGILYCYYLQSSSGGTWRFVRRASLDGRNWSPYELVGVNGTSPVAVSPALVPDGGNNVVMWYVRGTAGSTTVTPDFTTDFFTAPFPHYLTNGTPIQFAWPVPPAEINVSLVYYVVNATATTFQVSATPGGAAVNYTSNGTGPVTVNIPTVIAYRTSTDGGLTFGSENVCSVPKCADMRPDWWHLDAIKVGDTYHFLILSKTPSESGLWYYTSRDKATLRLECHEPAIPYSGVPLLDGNGNYRSTFVGKEGGAFDIWVSNQPRGATSDDTNYWPTLGVTCSATSPGVVTSTGGAHLWDNGDEVVFSGATPPTGITFGTTYYVKNRTNTTFEVAATVGGASINFGTTGTAVRASRNPWRLSLYRNVRLPIAPTIIAPRTQLTNIRTGGATIIPPMSCLNSLADAAWPTANLGLASRFQVHTATRVRYVNFHVGAPSGNIEVGILRANGVNHLNGYPIVTSGVIACPGAGEAKVDLTEVNLTPGDYWVYIWSDNTTWTTRHESTVVSTDLRLKAQFTTTAKSLGGKAVEYIGVTLDPSGNRFLDGLYLTSDF